MKFIMFLKILRFFYLPENFISINSQKLRKVPE